MKILYEVTGDSPDKADYMFWCPGCKCGHAAWTRRTAQRPTGPLWEFDGNMEAPTFSPSLLIKHGDGIVCHSFVRAGRIQYLDDCTHALAGQTVEMELF